MSKAEIERVTDQLMEQDLPTPEEGDWGRSFIPTEPWHHIALSALEREAGHFGRRFDNFTKEEIEQYIQMCVAHWVAEIDFSQIRTAHKLMNGTPGASDEDFEEPIDKFLRVRNYKDEDLL